MNANFNKIISLVVVFTFLFMLQVSTLPLSADPAPGASGTTLESPEQGPNVIEEEGTAAAPAKKKSILPILIGVVAVGAIAAVLALVVFKTKYDIVGTWDFNFTSTSPAHTWTWTLVFSGDKKSGNFIDNFSDSGTYKVDGKDVTIEYKDWDIQITGTFDGKDKMTGSATFTDMTIGGKDITSATWSASRMSSSSSLRPDGAVFQSPAGRKAVK